MVFHSSGFDELGWLVFNGVRAASAISRNWPKLEELYFENLQDPFLTHRYIWHYLDSHNSFLKVLHVNNSRMYLCTRELVPVVFPNLRDFQLYSSRLIN